jgi:CHAT domain-containing protein/tetratricopeptide (TPR) repeat protein
MFHFPCHASFERLAVGLLLWPALASAQSGPPPQLAAGQPATVRLDAKASTSFAAQFHAGSFDQIQVRQTEGMTEVTVVSPDGTTSPVFSSDGGIGSAIRIPLLPAQSGQYVLRVRSRERHAQAACLVTLLPERPPQANDEVLVRAETILAAAEQNRRQPSPGNPQPPEALIVRYDQALLLARQSGDQALERRALIGKARYQIFRIGQYQQGLVTAQQAAEIPASAGDTGQQALAWKTLASAQAFVNHYGEAKAAYMRALDLYRAGGDLYWQGVVWGNMASIYRETGETAQALQAAQSALELARKLSDDYGVAFTQATLGEIHQAGGEYQDALTAYSQSLDTAHRIAYGQVEGEVWTDLGELYTQLNDWDQAQHAYETALPILKSDGDGINEIGVLGHLGELAWHAGQPLAARDYFTQGLARAREQKLVREETFLEVGLARLCTRLPCAEDPQQMLRRTLASARGIGQLDGAAAVLELEGDLFAARHQPVQAMAAYAEAGSLWQQIPNKGELAMVQARIAALDLQAGRLEDARRQMESGLDAIETSRAQIAFANLRTSYFSSKHGYYDLAVEILMRLEQQHPGQGYAEQAWSVAERARARTLEDALQRGERDGGSMGSQKTVSIPSLSHRVLDDHTALLEYWTGGEQSYLWAITSSGMHAFTLPAGAVLTRAVHAYQQSMLARDTTVAGEDFEDRQRRIALADQLLHRRSLQLAHLLLPAKFEAKVDRLILVPDGDLLSLPFAALEWPTGGTPQYLIQHYDLVYEPSAATAMTLLSRAHTAPPGERIAIFADPVYSNADDRVRDAHLARQPLADAEPALRRASLTELAHLPRLPGSRKEAMAIAAIAGADNTSLYMGFDANSSLLGTIDWSPYSVVHFATHAVVDTDHPEFSAIVLSTVKQDGSPVSGVVGLPQIYQWNMPVSLVTLSGCQTAGGHLVPGEGIDGLSRAFLYAGAHSVMGTLWNAEDSSASELMQGFYTRYLHDHLSAPSALRAAQLALVSRGPYRAPWYWAGFILEGDWR